MVTNKKAISPVVATALLLVVAVVAVVGFQTWFSTYQSGLNTQVEQQSQTGSAVTVERLEATNGNVYLRNSGTTNITDAEVEISGNPSCGPTIHTLTPGVSNVSCGTNLTEDSIYDVVVVTNDGVFEEEQIAR